MATATFFVELLGRYNALSCTHRARETSSPLINPF